jgi:1,4-dihydroxy-2-naphthoate octaprenyltransferase
MILKTLLKALKPFPLISLIFTYALGGGLVQYVREMQNWSNFVGGGVFLLLVTLSFELLKLLNALSDVRNWPEDFTPKDAKQTRLVIAMITATFLTVATSQFIGWMLRGVLWQGLVFLLIALIVLGIFDYLAQINESMQIYQVMSEALLFVILPPTVAFFFQSQDLHRLLTLVVIGLVPAYLAYRLLVQLSHFSRDIKSGSHTVVTKIGWERAMVLHNALILLTYLLFALITLLGFPWFLLWPVFLSLPIGLLEIWLMERVRHGKKPLWRVMQIATAAVFLLPIYLISFAFWIR